jgi:hypothetical protein
MRRPCITKPLAAFACALACAAAVGALRAQPAAALGFVDQQIKQDVLLLRGYIEIQAARHSFIYPTRWQVRKGGGLSAPIWPMNPWTGKPMAPGSGRGTYTYTPAPGRHSYTLVAHFSSGSYRVTGGSPAWLATERAKAASDLAAAQTALTAAQNDLSAAQVAAKDSEAELGARIIKGYIEQWGLLDNGAAPVAGQVTPSGVGAGMGFWPKNPWTGADMAWSTGAGDFTYAPHADGVSYGLELYRSTGPQVDLSGSVSQQVRNATDHLRNELVKVNTEYLRAVVDRYALDNGDTFPAVGTVTVQSIYQYAFDYWPMNPWTGANAAPSASVGDYTYTPMAGGTMYQIAGHLGAGTDYIVDDSWAVRFFGMRERFKDLQAQASVQVLKDYIDEWTQAHGGVLPTAAEVAQNGSVGTAHAWWPKSPWTNAPMVAGENTGDFQYIDNGDGTCTLSVREGPFTDPVYGGAYPEYYTAQ